MISGREALIALANGEDVQASINGFDWREPTEFGLVYFLNDDAKFRLKPQTITINGVEVPACGKDYKHDTYMFVLNSLEACEYSKVILDESDEIPAYWWRTEEEIKQVVEALRQIFK